MAYLLDILLDAAKKERSAGIFGNDTTPLTFSIESTPVFGFKSPKSPSPPTTGPFDTTSIVPV